MSIQFHAIFARKHGEPNGYPVIASFSDPLAILKKYDEIVDASAGAEFRAAHAEIQLIQNLDIISQHEFPDPAQLERERKNQALAAAHRAKGEADRSFANLAAARQRADEASRALKTLTTEQKALLAEAEAEAKAQAEAAAKAQAEAEAAAKEAQARVEAAEKAAAAAAAAAAAEGMKSLAAATVVPPAAVPSEEEPDASAPESPVSAASADPLSPPDPTSLFDASTAQ